MPLHDPQQAFTWHLREHMATAGMFKTTDLVEPLREAGVHLSREQVYRLVTSPPVRLNMEVLAALCQILHCTPNDLIHVRSAQRGVRETRRTGTSNSGASVGELRPIPARLRRPPSE
ncbi:XRE family transcriptional regulator [Arthrobacter cheniae]|uniref:XRE family transcriptional regulator n=2 Tax=Arthrobacter cheniae TaxID=1258888 RepID=A0A3A5M2N8_9MICC|nr:XRE family transcriptional regulator [Arthrobacter cheniae]